MKKNATSICLIALISMFGFPLAANAEQHGLDEETIKQANNPLAPTKVFNVHNYAISSMYGAPDAAANQLILRYAQPIGNVFLRASMPFAVSSMPQGSPTTGFGDFSIFGIYKFPLKSEGINIGVGPLLVAPTGSHNLGRGKWQTGISAMAFFAKSRVVQFGTLLQWQVSFAGDKDRADVSELIPQVFGMWQLGGGTYLRSTGAWTFDLKNGHYNVPLGLGIGKVVKAGGAVFNIFIEPQYSVLAQGAGQARFQTFFGVNTQF